MHHIIYISSAVQPLSDPELSDLLTKARAKNQQLDITGALVYGDNRFMQIIEGSEAALAGLYAQLLNDPRHTNVVKLADKEITHRSFEDWSMAFRPASGAEFAQFAGYTHPDQLNLQVPSLSAADALLLEMMKSFVLHPFAGGAGK